MNDPRSSRGREGAAKRDLTAPSDLGVRRDEWKDLGEVSRGQQDISFIHEGHERHGENHVFFIHEGHEKHGENHVFFYPRRTRKARRELWRKDFKENRHGTGFRAFRGAVVLSLWGGLASKLAATP